MAYEDKKEKLTSGQDGKARPENQFVPEQASFSLPNSRMTAMPISPPGMPNSVMREMMDEQAPEADEDRRSGGIRSGMPYPARRQTGGGLSFGRGFDPVIGAHESTHTVRREAVPEPVSQSVLPGTVQREPEDDDDDDSDAIDFEEEVRKMNLNSQDDDPGPSPQSMSNDDFFSRFRQDPQKTDKDEDKAEDEEDDDGGIVFLDEDEDTEDAASAAATSVKGVKPGVKDTLSAGGSGEGSNAALSGQGKGAGAADTAADAEAEEPVKTDDDDDSDAMDFDEEYHQMGLDRKDKELGEKDHEDPFAEDGADAAEAQAPEVHHPAAPAEPVWTDDDEDDDVNPLFYSHKRDQDWQQQQAQQQQQRQQRLQQILQDLPEQMRRIDALWTDLERMPDHVVQMIMNAPRGDQTRLRLFNQLRQGLSPIAVRKDLIADYLDKISEMGQKPELSVDDERLMNLWDGAAQNMQQLEGDMRQQLMQQPQLLEAQRRDKLQQMHQKLDSIDPNLTGTLARPQVKKSVMLMRQKTLVRLEELKEELQKNPDPQRQRQLQDQMDRVQQQGKALDSLIYLQDHLLFRLSRLQSYLDNPPVPPGIDAEMDKADEEVFNLKDNQEFIQMIFELDDQAHVFSTGHSRYRLSKKPIPIDEMVKYYKAWRKMRGDDIGQNDVNGPVMGGLGSAAAVLPAAAAAPGAGPMPAAPGAGPMPAAPGANPAGPAALPSAGNYQGRGRGVRAINQIVPRADIPRNALVGANDIFKLIVMDSVHNYNDGNSKNLISDVKDPKWYDYWNPKETNGDYGWYNNKAAPAISGVLGLYGFISSAFNTYASARETQRKFHNKELGASDADWIYSAMDTFSSLGKTASGINGMVPTAGAATAAPWLGMITGTTDMVSGFGQAIRGARAWHHINQGMEQLGPMDDPDPEKNPVRRGWNSQTDQEKLHFIFKQGRSLQKINTWSNFMKGASGAMSLAGGISGAVGAAPVAAGFQLGAAALNIVRVAFEHGMKARLRHRVVAEDLGINWDEEMKLVREMIKEFNPDYSMRDKFVREIIMKAHGSTASTRTEAYGQIRQKRAIFLMNVANDYTHQYHDAAAAVVEAMGVHPVGTDAQGRKTFAEGAWKLLEEKMG